MTYYELTSIYGHDTFLLDVNNVGAAMKVRERAAQYSFSHHSHTLATLYYTLFFLVLENISYTIDRLSFIQRFVYSTRGVLGRAYTDCVCY